MKINFYIIFSFFSILSFAQNNSKTLDIKSKDTMLLNLFLPDHEVNTSDKEYLKKWNRTKFYVKSVYDYSRIASNMFEAFNDTLELMESNRSKKKYLKKANKMLKNEFGDEIKQMSITRGSYLMKLIYRNTGLTAYDIIKTYRGSGNAFWFQALCLVNGQNLKKNYDPEGEDYLIEKAVNMIESGRMNYFKRVVLTESAKKAMEQKKKRKKRK